jgi:hypothetical protein
MRKFIVFLMGLILFTFGVCIGVYVAKSTSDKKIAVNYIKSHGYKIITYKGQTQKYTLEKCQIYGEKNLPNMLFWALQNTNPETYIGKEITVYSFIVKNHPLDKFANSDKYRTFLNIMICENKIIGGSSRPAEETIGGADSLDGKSLEKVTGLTYEQWLEEWEIKYVEYSYEP